MTIGKGRRESGGASFVRPEKYDQDDQSGIVPFISSNSENKHSKGVELPENDIPVEQQEQKLFRLPGQGDRLW